MGSSSGLVTIVVMTLLVKMVAFARAVQKYPNDVLGLGLGLENEFKVQRSGSFNGHIFGNSPRRIKIFGVLRSVFDGFRVIGWKHEL